MTQNEISCAITLYLGFGAALTPQRNAIALIRDFGETRGLALQSEVVTLLNEMAGIKVDWSAHSTTNPEQHCPVHRATLI